MTNHFTSAFRQHRSRAFALVMLMLIVAGLALSPIATASADTSTPSADAPATDSTTTTVPATPTTTAPEPTTTTSAPSTTPTATTTPTAPATTAPATTAPSTTAPSTTAKDDDGVTADVESRAPHGGDNNQDGIADAEQANVASLPAAVDVDGNGKLDDYVTIVSPAGTSLHDVRSLTVPSDNPPPDGVSLPYGLFDYDVQVANPGDSAAVTYITPAGYVPSGVHFLQHGEWTDLADHTAIDEHTGDATVQLEDGGAGDANPAADGVIADPSGPSSSANSIAVTVSGAIPAGVVFKLEICDQNSIGGGCTNAANVPVANGSNDASGQSAALSNGSSWNWGGGGSTPLTQNRRYRLSLVSAVPSGFTLSYSCTGSTQGANSPPANARNIYLNNTGSATSTCTATFAANVASITVHKKGDRAANGSVNDLQGATFQVYSNNTYTTAVAGASCMTGANGACTIGNLSTNTQYWVRETTAPANFQRIDTLTTSANGSQIYGQAITTSGPGSNADSRNFANRRVNPAFPSECGINIGLVMDLSNSISDTELGQMKTSAKAFVTALQGTPSKVGGYTFATNAPASGNTNLALTDVSSASGADDARSWIDNRTKPGGDDGGTNWDAGLRQVVANAGSYDIVVFLTDGNPTFYGVPQSGGNGSSTTFDEVEQGVYSSNQVKAANSALKMVGVLIGSDGSVDNMQAVTGPTVNDDYFLAANFQDLQNKLQQIASQLCGGTVTVKKQVEGPGGFAPAGGWAFTVPGSTQGTGTTAAGTGVTPAFDVTPGTVTVTETQQPGYTIVPQSSRNASCTKNGTTVPTNQITDTANGVSLTVSALDIVACEFRNTPTKATVNVRKQTTGGVGGAFTIQRSGNGAGTQNLNFTTSAGSNPTSYQSMSLFPGTYTLTETALPAGWAFDTADCGTVDVGTKSTTLTVTAGQTVNCTVTNKSTAGTIELQKKWAGALTGDAPGVNLQIGTTNGGTQVANQSVTGPTDGSTGAKNVNPGTYFVQEGGLASGWLQTSLTCSTNSGAPVTYVPANGVAVPSAGSVVCTVTNTRQKGTIELKKVWTGGVAGETPHVTLQIGTGSSGGSASNVASQAVTGLGNGTTTTKDVGVGTYFVSETGLTTGWTQGALTCSVDGGASNPYVPATGIAVANGKAVVCTVTNIRDTGSIELAKKWSGALGGDAPHVTLQIGSANGGSDVANAPVTGPSAGTTGAQSVAAKTYFVQESGLTSGWLQTGLSCVTNGGAPVTYVAANGVAVPKNGTVVCTVTNTRQKGTLELQKVWSGGVAGEQPTTTLQIGTSGSPAGVTSQQVTGLADGSTGAQSVGIGTYFVSETGLAAGWAQTSLTCQNGSQQPVTYDPQTGVVIANGDDILCTVTNTRQTGSVKVDKTWSGGAVGETPSVNLVISGPSGSTTPVTGLAPGTTGTKTVVTGSYSVSETGLTAGWSAGAISCVRNGTGSSFGPSNFAVGANDAVVCSVTNTRNAASITVNKKWVGGAAGEQPTTDLNVVGLSPSTTTVTGLTDGTTGVKPVVTGTYSVNESNLTSGWAQSAATCVRNSDPTTFGPSNFAVNANDSVVCTITNTRKTGTVKVDKHWNGGVIGEQPKVDLVIAGLSGSSTTVTGLADGTTGAKPVVTGTYSASESNLTAGWSAGTLSCVRNGTGPSFGPSNFTVAADDSIVCTVTNTRQTGSVKVNKVWVGGAAGEQPKTDLDILGPSASSTSVTGLADGTTGVKSVVTGTYSVGESNLEAGWTQTAATCVRGTDPTTFPPSSFVVNAGDAVICTITNTRQVGSVTVNKTWAGGVAGETPQVNLVISGPSGSSTPVTGLAPGTTGVKPVVTGSYSVSETGLTAGWSAGAISCVRNGIGSAFGPSNFAVGANDAIVCSVTNTRNAGSVTVNKKWVGGVAGEQPTTDLDVVGLSSSTTTVTGLTDGTTGAKPVVTGTYSVNESNLTSGWAQSAATCVRNSDPTTFGPSNFSVGASDAVVCTITNTRQTGTVKVDKHWTGAADGETPHVTLGIAGLSPSSTPVTGPADGTTGTKTVATGTYSVSESGLTTGWTAGTLSCVRNGTGSPFGPSNFAVNANDAVVCTVTNTRDTGSIRVDKVWVGGHEGDSPKVDLNIGGPSASSTSVTGTAPGTTGTKTVVTGTYTVGEAGLPTAWYQQSITCQNGTQAPFTPTEQGFAVAKGDSVVCTITNARKGSITIVKDAKPNAAKDFGFTTSNLGGPFTLHDDGTAANTKVFSNVVAGAYSVTEDANPAGWTLTSVSCVGAGGAGDLPTRTATIQLPAGGDVTCTFTNTGPDVGIVKTDTPDPVVAGNNLTYSLAVHNYGPPAAAPVQVSDPLPTNTTFVSLTADPSWSCTTPAVGATGTVSCSLATLAEGADAPSITIVVKVGAGVAPGTDVITNTATVTTPNDSNPSNDSSTAKTSVVRSVDLKIVKSDGGATPTAGGPGFQYTLSVDNLGPSDASAAATVTDVIPAGISFVSFGTLPGGVSCTPPSSGSQTFTCTIPANQLDVSDPVVVIPVNVTVPSTTVSGNYTNKVIVSSSDDVAPCTVTSTNITCDPSDTNNYSQVTTPVGTTVDLKIVKTAPATGLAGNNVTYTLDVSNLGPSNAANVVVDDTLPAGLSFVSASGTGWTCSESPSGTVHCTRPALAVGSAPQITVVAHVASNVTGKVTNCATVTDAFPNDSNDTSCGDTTIDTKSDLKIVKTAPATGVAGNNVSYTLDVSNLGPSDATDVVVDDALPTGLSFVSAVGTGWTCSESPSGTVHCTRPALAVGSAPQITVVAHVAPNVTGKVTNCATVKDTVDGDDNDTSCGDTTITPEVDVSIVKTDTPDPVVAGENLTYNLAVANGGPSNATDVAVSDPLPADTTFVSLTADPSWSCTTPAVGDTGTISCTRPGLGVGSAPAITVVVKVDAGVAPGTDVIVNTATVTAPHDTNPDNNTSTAKTSVIRVLDLAVTKSDGGAEPVAGDGKSFTYTITVDNLGPSDAGTAATVTDTLPAGVSFVAFGTLPDGVDCTPPVAGVFTCTVDASLLQVTDPAVVITLDVTVPASTPAGTQTNTVVVSTPEEPCPGSPNCGNNTDHTDTPVTTSVDLTIHKTDGGATPVGGVAGSDAFAYTLTVDNDGPSDASADATVTDVLPPGIDFVSYGTLPAGVSCAPPDGRTLECTIAKGLLAVSSPEVVITVNVTVPATTPGGDVTNKVIVSNPDDEAPCTVTATDITCDPSDTNNYSEVTTPILQVAPDVVTPTTSPVQVEGASLAFTGSDGGRLALVGFALLGIGSVLVVAMRRRRRSGTS